MKKIEQTLSTLERSVLSLKDSVQLPPVEDRDYWGIIKAFETSYELTWKLAKLILEKNGVPAPFPRVALEEAFKRKMIEGNEIWKDIIEDRNLAVHTYDKTMAVELCDRIRSRYLTIFEQSISLLKKFSTSHRV